VWLVAALAVAIPAFWWTGKWFAQMIRRRWRRDIGEPGEQKADSM